MLYHLEPLNHFLQQLAPENHKAWAARVCKASRQAHIALWTFLFSPDDARDFLRLLIALDDPISKLDGCDLYHRNLHIRITSIESYLKSGQPIVPPDAAPEELILCDEARLAQQRAEELRKQHPSKCAAIVEELAGKKSATC